MRQQERFLPNANLSKDLNNKAELCRYEVKLFIRAEMSTLFFDPREWERDAQAGTIVSFNEATDQGAVATARTIACFSKATVQGAVATADVDVPTGYCFNTVTGSSSKPCRHCMLQ